MIYFVEERFIGGEENCRYKYISIESSPQSPNYCNTLEIFARCQPNMIMFRNNLEHFPCFLPARLRAAQAADTSWISVPSKTPQPERTIATSDIAESVQQCWMTLPRIINY